MEFKRMTSAMTVLATGVAALLLNSCSMKSSDSTIAVAIPAAVPNPAFSAALKAGAYVPLNEVQMSASAVQASSVVLVQFAAVSVTSSSGEFQEISQNWFKESGEESPTVVLQVPRGANRLVQVIAGAGGGGGGGGSALYYGDSNFDNSGGDVSLSLQMNPLATTAAGEAVLAGRFLRADGTGPSGLMKVMYKPTATKPAMTLFKTEVFAGWFQAMAPAFGEFNYVLDGSNETLMSGINATDAVFNSKFKTGNPARNALVAVPDVWRSNYSTPDPDDREFMVKRRLIAGFFGDGAITATKQLCYTIAVEDLTGVWPASTGATLTKWNGATSPPGTTGGVPNAGLAIASGTTTCSGTPFVDYLKFDAQLIRNRDKQLGFQGPFKYRDMPNRKMTSLAYSAGSMTVSWSYLPGIDAGVVTGVAVYVRHGRSPHDQSDIRGMMDGFKCGDPTLPMTLVGERAFTDSPNDSFVVNGVAQAEYDSANIQVLLCPFTNTPAGAPEPRKYWTSGIVAEMDQGGGGGGGGGASRLAVFKYDGLTETSAASRDVAYNSDCHPFEVRAVDANGGLAMAGSNTTIRIFDGSNVLSYSSACSDGYTQLDFSSFQSRRVGWFKSTSSGTRDLTVSVISGSSLTPTTYHVDVQTHQAPTILKMTTPNPTITRFACVPVKFSLLTATGTPASSDAWVDMIMNGDANWEFFQDTDPMCNSPISMLSFQPANDTTKFAFMRFKGSAGPQTFTPDGTDAAVPTPDLTVQSTALTFTEPVAPAKVRIVNLPQTMSVGGCYEFQVEVVSSSDQPTFLIDGQFFGGLTAMDVGLSATGGGFHSSMCSGGGSPTWTTAVQKYGSQTMTLKFSPSSPTWSISANPDNADLNGLSLASGNASGSAGPAQASRIIIVAPGETYTNGSSSASGTGNTQMRNVPFTVDLYALTPSNQIANSSNPTTIAPFNGTLNLVMNEPQMSQPAAPTAVTFVNGHATLSVAYGAQAAGASRNVRLMTSGGAMMTVTDSTSYFPVIYNPEPTNLKIYGMSTHTTNHCQPMMVAYENAMGYPQWWNTPTSITVAASLLTPSNYRFGYVTNCAGTTGPFSPGGGSYPVMQTIYFSSSETGSSDFTAQDSMLTMTAATLSVTVNSGSISGNATRFWMWGTSATTVGLCTPILVATTDSAGYALASTNDPQSVAYSSDLGGSFHDDPFCSGTVSTIPASHRSRVVYFLPTTQGAQTITVTGSGLSSGTHAITVYP